MSEYNENTPKDEQNFSQVVVTPRVDIMENDTQVVLIADMPGVSEKDVDIDLQHNCLSIKGNRVFKAEDGMKLTNAEFQPAYIYERQFTLGDIIDTENITASMKDGVLRLTLPKVKEATPRRIEVKSC